MKKTILSVATLVGLGFAGSAMAQAVDFNALDTDMDGQISFEELQVVLPEITQEDFDLLDQDGSGALSEQEFNVLFQPPAEPAPAPAEPAPADPLDAPADPLLEEPADPLM